MFKKIAIFCCLIGCLLGYGSWAEEDLGATPQLLRNVGFEEGTGERAAYWGVWPPPGSQEDVSSLRDSIVKHSGQYSGRLRITAPDYTGICTWHHPAVPVLAGQELILQFWMKAENVVERAGCDVQLRQGPDKIVGSAAMPLIKGSFDWKLITHRFVIPAGVDYICVVPFLYGAGTVWLDDFRLFGAPSIDIPCTLRKPKIDGRADDVCWQNAAELSGFIVNDGSGPPERPTRVKALCDAETLYFLFICGKKPQDRLSAKITKRDGPVWTDDDVEIFINPQGDFGDYYQFIVNPAGTCYDSHGTDASWDAQWRAACTQTPQFWLIEIAIPIRNFPLNLSVGDDWGLNLCRSDKIAGQASSWSCTFGSFHNPARFGRFLGLNFNLLPYYERDARKRVAELRHKYEAALLGLNWREAPEALSQPLKQHLQGIQRGLAELEALLAAPKRASKQDWAQIQPKAAQLAEDIKALQTASFRLRVWNLARISGATKPCFGLATAPAMCKLRRDGEDFTGDVASELNLSAACNEFESAQIVVVSLRAQEIEDCRATISPLEGPGGTKIDQKHISLGLVGYIKTAPPGYSTSYVGDWPDPIMPLRPFVVPAGQIQPLWLRIYVPPGVRPGLYRGFVSVQGGGQSLKMAVKLRVFDFELPRRQHLATPFGCAPETLSLWYAGSADYRTHMPVDVWKRWNNFLLDYRLTPTHVARAYVQESRLPDGRPQYDYSLTDECMQAVVERLPENGVALASLGSVGWIAANGASCQPVETEAHSGRRCGKIVWPKTDSWASVSRHLPGALLAERRCRAFRFWIKALEASDAEATIVAFVNCFPQRWLTTFKVGDAQWHEVRLPLEHYRHNTTGEKLDLAGLRICDNFQLVISQKKRVISFLIDDIVAECEEGDLVLDDFEEESLQRQLQESLGQQIQHFRARGWLRFGHIYAKDEIQPQEYAEFVPLYRLAAQIAPDAPLMQTYYINRTPQELVGPIKIWCAITSIYDEAFLSARRRAGEKTWLYVCCGPRPPYANFFIDEPGIDHRILFWQAWQRHCTGLLYWESNYWHGMIPAGANEPRWPDVPWEQTKVATYREFKVNGDGFLIYPGPNWTPWPSVRLENIRDGIEDYEYLCLLREYAPQSKELFVGNDISQDFTHFTKDPSVLLQRRLRIAAAIEAARRKK